jgi:hypothetical protein
LVIGFIRSSLLVTTISSYTLKITVTIAHVTSHTKSSNSSSVLLVYYNIITVLGATIFQLKSFKEGHAAESAEERRHSNHNMRAHLGIYI